MSLVVWHDVECGAYREDLPFWRALAREFGDPVVDVGAGTGRVALDLAAHGNEVLAVDLEPRLLAELNRRADGLPVRTHAADAAALDLGEEMFPLIVVPMQTIQLLPGAPARAAFLAAAHRHLRPGGVLALAVADELEIYDDTREVVPQIPDIREIDGVVYSSRLTAVRDRGDRVALERIREVIGTDGGRTVVDDVVDLMRLEAGTLEAEGRRAGLRVLPRREIPGTAEYVSSVVVMLGA